MKPKTLLLAMLLVIGFATKAQNYVTIPDTNFVSWLTALYPSCMSGNQMDTTCTAITTVTQVDVSYLNISNLTGIQYFTGLTNLGCINNQLASLPSLPLNLLGLDCRQNILSSLPSLPTSLHTLACSYNQLTSLPSLPTNLQFLACDYNHLTNLPSLSDSLKSLLCYYNQLTSLPILPVSLQYLYCANNNLTSLPSLPSNLQSLNFDNNQLNSLSSLPYTLQLLRCDSNNISCFPVFPDNITNGFSILGNPFSCLPNYIASMDAATLAFPLCISGDSINNPSGCTSAEGVVGYIYKDNNNNCIKDNGDSVMNNIPLKLFDNNNNLLGQTYSFAYGLYNFADSLGTYTVKLDTTGFPFTAQCIYPGIDSIVTLTNSNPLASNVNFDITCKPSFDIGVQSVIPTGIVFPGQPHQLKILAGDLSHWYNLNCASGISGQVKVTVTGNVTYSGIVPGALTPSISGNVFTYNISNFGTINNNQDFGLQFITDSTSQTGDQICVNVAVTPIVGDNDTANNNYQFCYQVLNSFDPNLKEVYPVNVLPAYHDWFTYTIHFQNTGNAPAINIRLVDTLNSNLDMETFQLINYSHHNTVTLSHNVLTFRFPNIQLPDSTSNPEGSKGFVQYRIKPKPNLLLGTQIKNTANIYFDYNAPITTNTTTNEFTTINSISSNLTSHISNLLVYPNPGKGLFTIRMEDSGFKMENVEVYNLLGEKVFSSSISNHLSQLSIDISAQPAGIYFVKVSAGNQSFNKKISKQ